MGILNLGSQICTFKLVEDMKKKAGINNLWKHEEDKRLNEHFKKHLKMLKHFISQKIRGHLILAIKKIMIIPKVI